MELTNVKTSELYKMPFNPRRRIEGKRFELLKESIQKHGILSPIVITREFDIIDGHRRVTCAEELGIEIVPAVFYEGEFTSEIIFEEVNKTQMKMNDSQKFEAVLSGMQIPKELRYIYDRLFRVFSKRELDNLVEIRHSPQSCYVESRNLAKYLYLDFENDVIFRQLYFWMATHHSTQPIRRAMSSRVKPEIIITWIDNNLECPF